MKIAIIVAMSKELSLLLPLISDLKAVTVGDNDAQAYTGRIGVHDVVAMQCGIGKVNAALAADALLRTHKPDLLLNTGVAGGLTSATPVMTVVVADRVAYHDVWCGPDTPWGQAAGCPTCFEADPAVAHMPLLEVTAGVEHGLLVSGDIFVGGDEEPKRILSRWPEALAVDMESGALAQVCYRRGVPFCCLRVISDCPGADTDNAAQYGDFWTAAPAHTFGILSAMVAALPETLK